MLCLPASLDALLVLLAPCFTRPTFQTFRALVVGQISQTALRTVCGMLVGSRLSGVWHHARAHRFFSDARWSADGLGLGLLDVILARLTEPGAALVVPVDDTLLHRLGRKVHGAFWHHDATANSDRAAVAWGNNWVVVGILVHLPFMSRPVCLPILFRLWQPKRRHIPKHKRDPERPGKPELAREMVDLIAARHPDRKLHVVGDSAYGAGAWRGLSEQVTLTVRPRKDAALYAPAPPRTGRRGRPALKGARLQSLAQIATDPATAWQTITATRYAKSEQIEVHVIDCLWHGALGYTPVRVLLVRDTAKPAGYQLALLTTDLDSTPAELIERYADRWPIEVCFEEAKQLAGVGQARNRSRRAVERTVPFQFHCMTLTILWYALEGHHPADVEEHRARAPWYHTKTNPSFADMLAKLRRTIIAAQFSPGRLRAPYQQKNIAIQQAWEAARG
ncbi:MAG: transposase [Actinobacteria bacterium]|nr:transposase [Actinomycetota bacterium]MCA1700724.1 transposase [Actinomycetota bacterium]